jgi:nicotinamide mononucleotide transporter
METWLFLHWIEIAGTLFAFIYLYFSINEKIWLWPTGFIASFFYLAVFFNSRLYADMGLQLYYLVVSVFGWYNWLGKRRNSVLETHLPTSSLSLLEWIPLLSTIVILNITLYLALASLPEMIGLPPSDMPALDAFTTAASIVATWMLARKILENWLIWIIVDAVSFGMYLYKELYVTSFLFIIYTVMAVIGYFHWKKTMQPLVMVKDKNL